ncbi:MAG: polysaccharide ABC transporter ATP-binding protein [Fibrobacter sp.]|nr:polysaccharide ABC transporter ATP-binding protein [Fibrobacter sp.]
MNEIGIVERVLVIMSTAIEFNNIGKMYRLGRVGTGTLSHDLNRFWQTKILRREDPYLKIGQTNDRTTKGDSDYVWALKNINFKVKEGEVLGIIGKNGAGKSTLLKLLSNITSPTTGEITAYGRIASLLEVGTGFHPEMTGRENIYMNGSIMGMTRSEINRKLDEIVDFAGVERYLDTPVKRYSSGMTVRLGFAVAAFLEPEILVVDEVLTVGDAEFQKKALGKMNDVAMGEGRTVLFVSHNMAAVRNLCTKGVVLQNGQLVFEGKTDDAVDYYIESGSSKIISNAIISDSHRPEKAMLLKEIEFLNACILNADPGNVANNEPIKVEITLKRNKLQLKKCQYSIIIVNQKDENVINAVTKPIDIPQDRNEFTVVLCLYNHGLPKGRYRIDFVASIKDFANGSHNYDVIRKVLSFDVTLLERINRLEFVSWDAKVGHILHYNGENLEVHIR